MFSKLQHGKAKRNLVRVNSMAVADIQSWSNPTRKTFLVSRHAAAQQWLLSEAEKRGWGAVVTLPHCQPEQAAPGDRVAGTLPIQLAAAVCARGAEYWHLEVAIEERDRGRELSFNELADHGATLRRYRVAPWEDE